TFLLSDKHWSSSIIFIHEEDGFAASRDETPEYSGCYSPRNDDGMENAADVSVRMHSQM
ncbi:unnamed protein product, partial [Musa hybrid cultivar]